MVQNPGNQNSADEKAKRLEDKRLKLLGYSFSTISFVVFVYILLFPVEKELKQQAIYWFASSFVAAIIPNVKQFKIKDFEVQLQEISQRIEDNKSLIEQKTEEIKESLFLSLESVREREESLPEEYKSKRELEYRRYAERLKELTPDRRLKEQKRFTQSHLNRIYMDVADLKKMLQKIGFYQGSIDEVFDEQLAQSISAFQEKYGVEPVDGTAGPKTLSKLSKVIKHR